MVWNAADSVVIGVPEAPIRFYPMFTQTLSAIIFFCILMIEIIKHQISSTPEIDGCPSVANGFLRTFQEHL